MATGRTNRRLREDNFEIIILLLEIENLFLRKLGHEKISFKNRGDLEID